MAFRIRPWSLTLALGLATLPACDAVTTVASTPPPDPFAAGDPVLGRAAFASNCAGCHASRDGFDLAHFGFADSTVQRRALAHVDRPTSVDIVAHVRGLRADQAATDTRPFQPGGVVLDDDLAFATQLFGADVWPDTLTAAALAAIEPLDVPVALAFPRWSVEENNLDWMPESGISDAVLDYNASRARTRLDEYYRTGSMQDLVNAVQGLRLAERAVDNPSAPCVHNPADRLVPQICFEHRRWAASLGAQYMLRYGIAGPVHSVIHDAWWDVGFAIRATVLRDGHFEHGEQNWANWMWMGWVFEPERHASIYLAQGLDRLGLPRHAVFHALRASVVRAPGTVSPYQDAKTAARFAPDHWAFAATRMAYAEIEARLAAGERVPDHRHDLALAEVRRAYTYASRKVDDQQAAELLETRDRILGVLGG